jgi:hypothetical protein
LADAVTFQIENGVLALAVVDKTAVGYSDTWQAPGGKTVDTVTEADYDASSATWKCQVTSGMLTPSADTTTTDVAPTFCNPARTIPTPGETSYTLDAEFLQDVTVSAGLSRFLFEHDTEEGYFLLGLNGDDPPKAIGRVRLQAGAFGGAARATLTSTVSLPLSRKPQIEFGDATTSAIVPPTTTPATGATAGTPGSWTPSGSTPPASVAALTAGTPNAVVASPTTAWTTGQYVQTATAGTPGQAHWSGTAWTTGAA